MSNIQQDLPQSPIAGDKEEDRRRKVGGGASSVAWRVTGTGIELRPPGGDAAVEGVARTFDPFYFYKDDHFSDALLIDKLKFFQKILGIVPSCCKFNYFPYYAF